MIRRCVLLCAIAATAFGQGRGAGGAGRGGAGGQGRGGPSTTYVLKAARVFDGEEMHEGWAVRVRGDRIEAAGPAGSIDSAGATVVDLAQATLMPGLVEGH